MQQIYGCGLFGGRGEYVCRVRLLRACGDAHFERQEVLAETDELVYECPARDTACILLPRPVLVQVRSCFVFKFFPLLFARQTLGIQYWRISAVHAVTVALPARRSLPEVMALLLSRFATVHSGYLQLLCVH